MTFENKNFEDLSEFLNYLKSKYNLIYSSTSTDDLDWYTWTGTLSTKGGKRVLVIDYDWTHAATDFTGCDIASDFFGEDIAEEIRGILFELR